MRTWISQLRRVGLRFLRWWGGELTAAAESVLAWIAPRWFRTLVLFVDEAEVSAAYAPIAPDAAPVVRSPYSSSAPLTSEPPADWHAILTRQPRTRLVLRTHAAYTHTFYLPLAALSQAATAAALQYPRLLPMSPDRLLVDHRLVKEHPEEDIAEFTLAALKRAEVERLLECLEGWGLKITDLRIGDSLGAAAPFHFPLGSRRARERSSMPLLRLVDRLLLGSAAALAVICVSLAATNQWRASRAVAMAEAVAREPASAIRTEQSAVDHMLAPLSFMATRQNESGPAVALRELSALVPRETWISTLDVNGRTLRIVGLTPDPTGLVRILSTSKSFQDVQLRSSMSAGQNAAANRFEMTMKVSGGKP